MATVEEVMALPLDTDEDHDFFAIKRKERMDKRAEQEKERAREIKAIRRKRLEAGWKEDGEKGMSNMRQSLNFLKFILTPHNFYKACMQQLLINEQQSSTLYFYRRFLHRHRCPESIKLLLVEVEKRRHATMLSKSILMRYKFGIMRELKSHFLIHRTAEWEYRPTPSYLTVTRHLFRAFMQLIRVDAAVRKELDRRREVHKAAVAKLDLIHRTQAACEFILTCNSAQHTNPNGCTRCGVFYMHGMLDGGTMYVKSVSRDTGVPTLVTLGFEMHTLQQEDEIQRKIVAETQAQLDEYESVVLHEVLTSMQQWIAFVCAFRHYQKVFVRQKRSLYYHRIRRLVVLKREIDRLIIEAPPIDMRHCEDKYWDVMCEMREYVALQQQLKDARIRKWAERLRKQLHVLVAEGRERRYQEWLRLQSIPPPPKPLVIRTAQESPVLQAFVCFRLECRLRRFISKERFDIHMAVHRREDQKRNRRYEQQQQEHARRRKAEAEFMERIERSRRHLLQRDAGSDVDSSRDSLDDKQLFDYALTYSHDHDALGTASDGGDDDGGDDNDNVHSNVYGIAVSKDGLSSKYSRGVGVDGRHGVATMLVPETDLHIKSGDAFAATAAAVSVRGTPLRRSTDHRLASTDSAASALLGVALVRADTGLSIAISSEGGTEEEEEDDAVDGDDDADEDDHSMGALLLLQGEQEKQEEEQNARDDNTMPPDHPVSQEVFVGPLNDQLVLRNDDIGVMLNTSDRHGYNRITDWDHAVHAKHVAGDAAMRTWQGLEHVYVLNGLQNTPMYSLELVSKQGEVDVPQRVPLDRPVMRIGTYSSCELCVQSRGVVKREGKIAKIHCLLYCPMYDDAAPRRPHKQRQHPPQSQLSASGSDASTASAMVTAAADQGVGQRDLHTALTIVDNHSVWGTYVVSPAGTQKVPSKVTAGAQLQAGLLICIGVCADGPAVIAPTLANQACVVYRVRCIDAEHRV